MGCSSGRQLRIYVETSGCICKVFHFLVILKTSGDEEMLFRKFPKQSTFILCPFRVTWTLSGQKFSILALQRLPTAHVMLSSACFCEVFFICSVHSQAEAMLQALLLYLLHDIPCGFIDTPVKSRRKLFFAWMILCVRIAISWLFLFFATD